MPVTWKEVERFEPLEFSPEAAVRRMRRDLFAPLLTLKQKLPIDAARAARPLARARGDSRRTQSGRREFIITRDELSLEMDGKWRRWPLRSGALPDRGIYELIEGSDAQERFDLWFTGDTLRGEWILEKSGGSWSFSAAT